MAEHLTEQQFLAFGQQRLPPAELLRLDAHLSACATCRQSLETALSGSALALHAELQTALPDAPPHLTFAQLAAYVDETLAPVEQAFATDHAATCAQCAAAVDDLRAFTAADDVVKIEAPLPVTAKTSWRERWRRSFAPVPTFGLALAALLLVVLAGWLWRLTFITKPPEFARQPTASPTLAPSIVPTPASTPAPLLAQLNDGGQVTLDQQGKLTGLDALSPAHQQMVKNALTTQRLAPSSALADLQRPGSSLLGTDEQGQRFALQAPVGKVVLSDRPTFKWSPLAGAASYVVEVYDEQFKLAAQSAASTQTQWTTPRPLARGRLYAWQVKASKDGQTVTAPAPPAPQARFRVVASAPAAEIAQARRAYAGSHLPLALLYVQAGLLDEAEAELRALRQANPNSVAARQWLAQLKAMRR